MAPLQRSFPPWLKPLVTPLLNTVLDLLLGCTKLVCFCCKFISIMPDDNLEGEAVGKIRMQYVKRITDARF